MYALKKEMGGDYNANSEEKWNRKKMKKSGKRY